VQETRGWNDEAGHTFSQRSKEEAHDYRYFPDPDLPPLRLEPAWIEEQKRALPELPADLRKRLITEGMHPYAAGVLTSHPGIARFFAEAIAQQADPTRVANFIMSELMRDLSTDGLEAKFAISPAQVAGLLKLVDAGTISGKQAKDVYGAMAGTELSAEQIVRDRGMAQVSDASAIEEVCARVIAASPKQAAQYRSGKTGLMGYFVGQVMKETRGSANPQMVNDVLARLLKESGES